MVDEKLDDQVWITVVATGYGDGKPRRDVREPRREEIGRPSRPGALREPAGEPRVSRVRTRSPLELDVPEFIPRR
jgi:cell division protein FtsZ